ncbi:MAG: hypothetical protein COA79_19295 [Planctomycetota bacterium]|nr:MAG: hypothetical protein COA79_19295 [Planctomycetota bacterium]
MKPKRIKLLYRKVNTKARGVWHLKGPKYKHSRNAKSENKSRMTQGHRRGLDYTPLYNYLISKVGQPWEDIYSFALPRVECEDFIFRIVSIDKDLAEEYICVGENSYYSVLLVDSEGVLEFANPKIDHHSLTPDCSCCTHSFNGKPFSKIFIATSDAN